MIKKITGYTILIILFSCLVLYTYLRTGLFGLLVFPFAALIVGLIFLALKLIEND